MMIFNVSKPLLQSSAIVLPNFNFHSCLSISVLQDISTPKIQLKSGELQNSWKLEWSVSMKE